MNSGDALCVEFKVACDIYYCNSIGEVVTRKEVVSRFEGLLSEETVAEAVKFLLNWGIVRADFSGEILSLFISSDAESVIADLCNRYWIPVLIERTRGK